VTTDAGHSAVGVRRSRCEWNPTRSTRTRRSSRARSTRSPKHHACCSANAGVSPSELGPVPNGRRQGGFGAHHGELMQRRCGQPVRLDSLVNRLGSPVGARPSRRRTPRTERHEPGSSAHAKVVRSLSGGASRAPQAGARKTSNERQTTTRRRTKAASLRSASLSQPGRLPGRVRLQRFGDDLGRHDPKRNRTIRHAQHDPTRTHLGTDNTNDNDYRLPTRREQQQHDPTRTTRSDTYTNEQHASSRDATPAD
jgi:hypothetical protein